MMARVGFYHELGEDQLEDKAHLDAEPDGGGAEVEDEERGKNDAGGRTVRPLHSCERDTITTSLARSRFSSVSPQHSHQSHLGRAGAGGV